MAGWTVHIRSGDVMGGAATRTGGVVVDVGEGEGTEEVGNWPSRSPGSRHTAGLGVSSG